MNLEAGILRHWSLKLGFKRINATVSIKLLRRLAIDQNFPMAYYSMSGICSSL